MINTPTGSQAAGACSSRRVLTHDLRISGTPVIDIQASLSTTQIQPRRAARRLRRRARRSRATGEGIVDANPASSTCWGESSTNDSACYRDVPGRPQTSPSGACRRASSTPPTGSRCSRRLSPTWASSTGSRCRRSRTTSCSPAGHQIGIILVANYTQLPLGQRHDGQRRHARHEAEQGAPADRRRLPRGGRRRRVRGRDRGAGPGRRAGRHRGRDGERRRRVVTFTAADGDRQRGPEPRPSRARPPRARSSASGPPRSRAPRPTPRQHVERYVRRDGHVDRRGRRRRRRRGAGHAEPLGAAAPRRSARSARASPLDYFTSLAAVVTSTAADAALSVTDATGDGRMANGAFLLAQPLQAKASSATNPGGAYAAVGGTPARAALVRRAGEQRPGHRRISSRRSGRASRCAPAPTARR